MRETVVANCEKAFLLKALLEGKRVNGRKENEHRKLEIVFGNTWGCCMVSLGETRVMARTTYEVQVPKSTRPNEGLLIVNVELSAMAAQHIEPGRPSEASVQLNRLLEKCLKESKCIDLESLCIVAEEKVWAVRVDVTALNHDGALVDCASLAALASLAHSRRPDVTLSGEEVTIHTFAEREPLSLTLHHNPICVSYAIFDKGNKAIVDPTAAEEEAAETNLVIGMNAFRELCGLHLDGAGLPSSDEKDIVLQCVNKAGERAVEIINVLKQTLADDEQRRLRKEKVGLSEFVKLNKMSSLSEDKIPIRLHSDILRAAVNKLMNHKHQNKRKVWDEDGNAVEIQESDEEEVNDLGDNTAELVNQRSKVPRRIHVNLGKMEGDSGSEEDEEDEEEDDEEEEADMEDDDEEEEADMEDDDEEEDVKDGIKAQNRTIEVDPSDSDSDVMEIPVEEEEVKPNNKKKAVNENLPTGNAKQNNKSKKGAKLEEPVSDDSDDVEVIKELTYEEKMRLAEKIVLDDSEEEETVVLPGNGEAAEPQRNSQPQKPSKQGEKAEASNQKNQKKKKKKNNNKKTRTWYPQGKW